jgi:hypothetical protein
MTDTSTQPVAAASAFARARAALIVLRDRLSAWWADPHKKWPVEWIVIVAALLIFPALLVTCSDTPGLEQRPSAEQPAAVQINPLAELVDRIDELEAMVAELQERRPVVATRPGAHRASGASENHLPSPAPGSQRWGTTDLDREIEEFSQSISLESTK